MPSRAILLSSPRRLMSRRNFLAAASALCAVRVASANAPAAQAKIVVGAHPWVYAATQPKYDITPVLPQIFEDMKYAGLDAIELMHTAFKPAGAVDRIGDLSRKHSLPVLGSSFGGAFWDRRQHQQILDDAEVTITGLKKLGGRTLGTSVGAAGRKKTPAEFDAQTELLRKIIDLASRNGVVVNLHNHTYEVTDNLHDLRGTLERLPDVPLGPDLNWLIRGGVDPIEFLARYKKQIVFLHLRDQGADGKWVEAMGEGSTDFVRIARTLREIGFHGDAVIELAHERTFKPTRPLRESLKISRDYVRKVFGW